MTDLASGRIEPGVLLSGRYRLESIVGSGGMAVVWRARDEALERPVAIKVMSDALAANPAYVARFGREARLAARIAHPNLVAIYDFSATADRPYLVMQYIEGGTLEDRLRLGPLPEPAALGLARDLLGALGAVHEAGILHRDVKPANVLLDRDGPARLTDFGVAWLDDSTALTQPGQLVGTLRFLAPELTQGGEPSPRSDLFALGMLLGDARGGPADPSGPLDELIDLLTRPNPAQRPADAAAALVALPAGAGGRLSAAAVAAAETPTVVAPAPAASPGPDEADPFAGTPLADPIFAGDRGAPDRLDTGPTAVVGPDPLARDPLVRDPFDPDPLARDPFSPTRPAVTPIPPVGPERPRAASRPGSDRTTSALALLVLALVVVVVLLAATAGGGPARVSRPGPGTTLRTAGPRTSVNAARAHPGRLSLLQRLELLRREVASAPAR